MHEHDLNLDAGALCLEFANTVEWHASDHPDDRLHDYAGLIAWAEGIGLLAADRADRLREAARAEPEKAGIAFHRATELRETIYRLFASYAEQGVFEEGDLAQLNEGLGETLAHARIVPAAGGFEWGWTEAGADFNQILWPVLRSAADLLASDTLDRVRQCADDRGCGYLFVDTSRNRSRRWCSMESCGNRAKAQRHYRRQKQGK
ncbi:MAG: CGNR zinc finger domain-containing protein [Candidatus Promineifilaceae bacterium]|jgi:predicted RNA-binding Zn ribbon-like protein